MSMWRRLVVGIAWFLVLPDVAFGYSLLWGNSTAHTPTGTALAAVTFATGLAVIGAVTAFAIDRISAAIDGKG